MKKSSSSLTDSLKSVFAAVVIPVEIVLAVFIYLYVLGNPDNFQGSDPANNPLPGNYMGIVYKGGYIVPLLIGLLMIVLTFAIERFLTISGAKGKGNIQNFIRRIKSLISSGNLAQAVTECDKQKGSVANVVKAGLSKYEELAKNSAIEPDKKVLMIQKDIEETTQLEMPMLEKNLVIIATIASI